MIKLNSLVLYKGQPALVLELIGEKYTIEFCSIAGETVYGADEDSKENSDMFYPDPDELYRTVIDIFYVKEG